MQLRQFAVAGMINGAELNFRSSFPLRWFTYENQNGAANGIRTLKLSL